MDGSVKELLVDINEALREYFDVRRQRGEIKLKFDKKQSQLREKFDEKDKPLAEQEAALVSTIRELVIPKKLELIAGKLRSFGTTHGKVSFKKKPETTKIDDTDGFERRARKDGKLTTLGVFSRTWKPKKIKDVLDWMSANPKLAKSYEPFLSTDGGFDELYIQPNDAYLTDYDPNRLTERSVNLGRADEPVEQADEDE